jgi:hypothetical protein
MDENEIEFLLNNGWKEIFPTSLPNFRKEFKYKLTDNIYILLADVEKYGGNVWEYYMTSDSDPEIRWVNFYKNSGQYYEVRFKINKKSDYEKMIIHCESLIPFYEKIPSKELIEEIKDSFIDIFDIYEDNSIYWGYNNGHRDCTFPSIRLSDELALNLKFYYSDLNIIGETLNHFDYNQNWITNEFEYGKKKLRFILKNDCDLNFNKKTLWDSTKSYFLIKIYF